MPHLVEKLINYIEMHGLYTEGIYRKSGSTNKVKELRQGLDTGGKDSILTCGQHSNSKCEIHFHASPRVTVECSSTFYEL